MKKFILVLIVIHCLIAFTPYMSGVNFAFLDFGIMIFTMIHFIGIIKNKYLNTIGIPALLLILLMIFYSIIGRSSSSVGSIIFVPMAFMYPFFLTMYCMQELNFREKKSLVMIVLMICLVNILYNSYAITLNPLLASDYFLDKEFSAKMNIGGTDYSHFALFLTLVSLCAYNDCKKKNIKYLMILLMVISIYYIVACGMRATVVIFLIVSFPLIAVASNVNRSFIFYGILLLATIVLIIDYNSILRFLISLFDSERLSSRFESLLETNTINDDSFSGRVYYYRLSIETFFSSFDRFLFGVGAHPLRELDVRTIGMVGGHSQIFDLLAQYGVLGFLIMILLFSSIAKYFFSLACNKIVLRQYKILFVVLILFSCFKYSFNAHVSLLIFFILPMANDIWSKNNIRNETVGTNK